MLGLILSNSIQAQDTVKLQLHEALEAVAKSNSEILLATIDRASAVAKFNQTNAIFLPQVNLSYTAMVTNNPLNAFGFKLQQQSVAQSDFNPALLNDPPTTQNYMAKIELSQPLINLDMVYQRRAAGQQIDVYHYKVKRTKEYLRFEVQKAYASLQLAHQAVTVLIESLNTVTRLYESSKNYFEKGYLQKSDLLQVQVQVAMVESKLAEAKSSVRNASDFLSLLMGVKSGPVYAVAPLEKNASVDSIETQVPEDRADFKVLQSALQAQESVIRSSKIAALPKLNAFANYMFNDKAAFGFASNAYLVGAQFSWNLFEGTSRHYRTSEQKLTHAKIKQQLNYQKEQSQLELNRATRQLKDAQYAILQHETSVRQTAEALRIVQDRFDQGLASANDVLRSQSSLSEQKLLLTESVFKYNTTLAHIRFMVSLSQENN